jgi:hypothetical protein
LIPLFAVSAIALAAMLSATASTSRTAPGTKVFELRTYHTHPGRLGALHARFRDHTCGLFKKHGMELVGFWTPQVDQKGKGEILVYLLAFPSREAAAASWQGFRDDPEWKAAKEASEKDGPIVKEVESVFLDPTDYSPIR